VSGPRELALDALQTAFRLAPWPTRTGLRSSGSPGPESPVLITGNYDLTVRRLMRALRGVDAWVVVAPSGGINVWCAAAGGILTTHQVVTALKTSGIEQRVRHRRAILPQLAATGVLGRELTRRSGWKVRFGPVRAEDLPRYLANREKKTNDMRRVRFDARERLEMAAAWAVPTALVLGAGAAWLRPAWALPLVGACAALSLAVFFAYDRTPGPRRAIFAATAALLATAGAMLAGGGAPALVAAPLAGLGLVGLLTFDYTGSTPIEGGSHFESRRWKITLDLDRCVGTYRCVEVCPEACFKEARARRKVELAHDERCVKCGACVVQCPEDALFFTDEAGRRIEPDAVRRYKLNLFGTRGVDTGAPPPRAD
jgi:NAD-dependent dihydropyrimidine dehydrogenase PreA subunit